eukprot:7963708-Ditylum_brightwellii.AAC.1
MPTSKHTAYKVQEELILMMDTMRSSMTTQLQELQEEKILPITEYITKISSTVLSNEESLQKIRYNLNTLTQTISKLDTKQIMQKEINSAQQKDINKCTSGIASHDQNNKAISFKFEEKWNKAILNTKQVAANLSEACNKATSSKFQLTNSGIDNIDKTLHDQEEEIQLL